MHTKILKSKKGISRLFSVVFAFVVVPLALYVTTGRVLADVSEDFEQAQVYDDNGKYPQAVQIYENIITEHSGTEHALRAQNRLTRMHVFTGHSGAAQTACQQLIDNFSQYDGIEKAICEVADSYLTLKPQRALELYQYVIDTWSDPNDEMWAQSGVVKANVMLGNESSAQAAYGTLLTQYDEHTNICEAVYDVGDTYRFKSLQKALDKYNYAINTWPDYDAWIDEDDAILRQTNLVILRLSVGDESGAQAAYEDLLTTFSGNYKLPGAVLDIANACLVSGNTQKATELYQYTKTQWSGTGHHIWAEAGLVNTNIATGNDPNDTGIDELLTDFSEDSDLAKAVYTVTEQYHYVALTRKSQGNSKQAGQYFAKIVSLGRKLIKDLLGTSDPDLSSEVRYLMGQSYQKLGDFGKAIEYYEQVVAGWPDGAHAWSAQFRIGRSWEQLEKAGAVTRSEAQSNIRYAYQKVLQDYPHCPAVKAAKAWLQSHGKSN